MGTSLEDNQIVVEVVDNVTGRLKTGHFKTGHSKVVYSYQVSWCRQGTFNWSYLLARSFISLLARLQVNKLFCVQIRHLKIS